MVIFHSYVSLPEGTVAITIVCASYHHKPQWNLGEVKQPLVVSDASTTFQHWDLS
jgi:hypothetical protein